MFWVGFLIATFLSFGAYADALNDLVHQRLSSVPARPAMDFSQPFGFERYIPIQSFEYHAGREVAEDSIAASRTVRMHLKSFTELTQSFPSRRLTEELLTLENEELDNQRRFDAYLTLVQQVLIVRLMNLLNIREEELKASMDHGSALLKLPKAQAKDLVDELTKLQKVGSDFSGVQAQAGAFPSLDLAVAKSSAQSLIEIAVPLSQRLADIPTDSPVLQIERVGSPGTELEFAL